MSASVDRGGTLLCLNLRREHAPADADAALVNVKEMLTHARRCRWLVLHVFAVLPQAQERGALTALEPLPEEPVFALGGADLSEVHLAQLARASRPSRQLFLVGGVFSRAGLVTVAAAHELGCNLSIIEDACFSPQVDPEPASDILDVLSETGWASARLVSARMARGDPGGNVICLRSWLT